MVLGFVGFRYDVKSYSELEIVGAKARGHDNFILHNMDIDDLDEREMYHHLKIMIMKMMIYFPVTVLPIQLRIHFLYFFSNKIDPHP